MKFHVCCNVLANGDAVVARSAAGKDFLHFSRIVFGEGLGFAIDGHDEFAGLLVEIDAEVVVCGLIEVEGEGIAADAGEVGRGRLDAKVKQASAVNIETVLEESDFAERTQIQASP